MKIFHKELYPIEPKKTPEAPYTPIPAAKQNIEEEKGKDIHNIRRVNLEFEKEKSFAEAFKEQATLKNLAIALAVAVAVAAVVAACVFAFPAVAAVAGTAMAAVGISGASTVTIAATCAVVAGATTFGTKAFLDASGAVRTAIGTSISVPEHNAKILEDNFPQINEFLKQINGVKADKNRNSEFDKDLKDLTKGEKVQDLMIAIKRGDVAKIQELLPNKEISEIQGALNKVQAPAPVQQAENKAPAVNMEIARTEAIAHAAQVTNLQSTTEPPKASKAETITRGSGQIER